MRTLLLATLAMVVPGLAQAQDTGVLAHQGRLLDPAGGPLNGVYPMTFRLWDGSSDSASALWVENQLVNIGDGYYSVVLGQEENLEQSMFDGAPLWIGVQLGDDESGQEMRPRQIVSSTPYARFAHVADNATGDITPHSILVNGRTVVSETGEWTGPAPSIVVENGPWLSGDGTAGAPLGLDISGHTGDDDAHHSRFTAIEAVGALSGHTGDASAHHSRFTASEAVGALSGHTGDASAHHTKFTSANAVSALSNRTVELHSCAWTNDRCEVAGTTVYLDRANNLACPAGKVMTQFDVANCGGGNYQMKYYCCSLRVD